jgi:hypothetical protein
MSLGQFSSEYCSFPPPNMKQLLHTHSAGTGTISPHRRVQTGSGAQPASYLMCPEVFPLGIKRPGVKLTTHFHLVPRLRMRGATSPCPHTSSWSSVQLSTGYVFTAWYLADRETLPYSQLTICHYPYHLGLLQWSHLRPQHQGIQSHTTQDKACICGISYGIHSLVNHACLNAFVLYVVFFYSVYLYK